MLRTLVFAGLVTFFGATASNAQYRDSAPPEDYNSDYETESTYDGTYYDGYDEELLGSPDYRDGHREPDINVGIFASLGSHGGWHFAANFGWVWRPYANAGWRPYSQGRWVWTSHGWTWVSYEPYGWATYHYGYWANDPLYGWVWIPGYEWSAARVQFAYYDNYISWAPMAPPGYYCPQPWSTAGISFWFTVGAGNFCDPYPVRHCVTPTYKSWYSERVAYKSPDRHFVESYSGSQIRTSTVAFKNKSAKFTTTTKRNFVSGSTSQHVSKSRSIKSESRVASPQRVTKSRSIQSESRVVSAPKRVSRSHDVAIKNRGGDTKRQIQAQESRRSMSTQKAVKPQRQSQETSVARNERPSKQLKAKSTREQRSVQAPPQRAERTSRQSVQTSRGQSSERKATYSTGKSSSGRRDVAKSKGSGKGKAR